MYKIEKCKPFYATLKSLMIFYEYPRKIDETHLTSFYIKSFLLRILSILFCCFLSFLHLIMIKKGKIDIDVSEDYSLVVGGTGVVLMCGLFPWQWKKWSLLFCAVADFTKFGTPPNANIVIRRCNLLSKLFATYCTTGVAVYAVIAFFGSKTCERINEEKGLHQICNTMTTVWLPFEINSLSIQLILFGVQCIVIGAQMIPGGLICFLAWETSEIITLHLSHLKKSFIAIFDDENATDEQRNESIKLWVQYHKNILRVTAQLNTLTKICMGHLSLIAALVFGCMANQVIRSKPLGALANLIGWLVSLFLLCDAGQKIADQTASVSEAVYHAKWYFTDVQIMKKVLFILMRSQKPLVLDALPFGILNYPLYLMILKTSYSFLTLLSNTI